MLQSTKQHAVPHGIMWRHMAPCGGTWEREVLHACGRGINESQSCIIQQDPVMTPRGGIKAKRYIAPPIVREDSPFSCST